MVAHPPRGTFNPAHSLYTSYTLFEFVFHTVNTLESKFVDDL